MQEPTQGGRTLSRTKLMLAAVAVVVLSIAAPAMSSRSSAATTRGPIAYSFISWGDIRPGSTALHASYSAGWRHVRNKMAATPHAFEIAEGDMVNVASGNTTASINAKYADLFTAMGRTRSIRKSYAMGDHEAVGTSAAAAASWEKNIRETHYNCFIYGTGTATSPRIRVINLSTYEAGHLGTIGYRSEGDTSNSAQADWLVGELRARAWDPNTFLVVSMHHSLADTKSGGSYGTNATERTALETLFDKYGVDLVLAGSVTQYVRHMMADGTPYLTQGMAGADPQPASAAVHNTPGTDAARIGSADSTHEKFGFTRFQATKDGRLFGDTFVTSETTWTWRIADTFEVKQQAPTTPAPSPPPTVTPPTIAAFAASPTSITSGGSSTLSWTITDATSASIDRNVGAVAATSGTTSVSPTATTTYTLTAANSGGSVTSTATVTVATSPPTTDFQPSAPYYATFLYPWYRNVATDGSYSYWHDQGNTPPTTWFSHYLPDLDPSKFDPASELYSSLDYAAFRWQVGKMAEARQEVAITSWFGQGTKQDVAISKYLNDFMKRADNPYPNLRFALYYEDEGFGDPTVSQLVNDLTYIKSKYASSPYFLKVKGKPAIFVYGDASDGTATSRRWKDANTQMGNAFYYVLKVYSGYAGDPNQPSSWHQYAPASRYNSYGGYSTYVSPGFWKDAAGETVRLGRDLTAFSSAVTAMVGANTTWKLVETWNEWGEGSSVEPGQQTQIDTAGREVRDPNGKPFGNAYIKVLADSLPALEGGTGGEVPRRLP